MRKTGLIFLMLFLISTSCKTKNIGTEDSIKKKEQWKTSYKKMFVVLCFKKAGIDLEKDNTGAILLEQMITEKKTMKEIDSLSTVVSVQIKNTPSYFEGKPIISKILDYYTSKELDTFAEKRYSSN